MILHIPSSVGFSAHKFHTIALTAILYTYVTQTTPTHQHAGNSHDTQLAATCPDWDKCFPTWNGCCAGQEDCFLILFVHRRTAVAHSEPTKVFPKQNPQTAMLSALFGCTHHLPLSHPFCWSRTYLQRSLQEVTSKDDPLCLYHQLICFAIVHDLLKFYFLFFIFYFFGGGEGMVSLYHVNTQYLYQITSAGSDG